MFYVVGGEGVYLPGLYYGRLSNQLHCKFWLLCNRLSLLICLLGSLMRLMISASVISLHYLHVCRLPGCFGRWLLTSQAPTGIPSLLSLCITLVLRALTSTSLLSGPWAMSSRTMTGIIHSLVHSKLHISFVQISASFHIFEEIPHHQSSLLVLNKSVLNFVRSPDDRNTDELTPVQLEWFAFK